MTPITINTPALLFPAISLMMLAYTNRFYAIANRVRSLHDEFAKNENNKKTIFLQIKNLRRRLNMIRYMQAFAVLSFLCSMITMYLIFREFQDAATIVFLISIVSLIISTIISLQEIFISTKALEIELSDMEGIGKDSILDFFKK
jgi:hypothetical protein